jgi:hypothetical protein
MSEGFYKHMSSPRMDHRYSQMANLPLSVLQKIFTYFWFDAHSASKANTLITKFSENKDDNDTFQANLKERQGANKSRTMGMRNNAARLKPLQEKQEKCH